MARITPGGLRRRRAGLLSPAPSTDSTAAGPPVDRRSDGPPPDGDLLSDEQISREKWLLQARALRRGADDATTAFLEFLVRGESMTSLWDGTGLTYEAWICSEQLISLARYRRYVNARRVSGAAALNGVGLHAVLAAGALPTEQAQKQVLEETRAWEATNGTAISEQRAREIARHVRARMRGPERSGYLSYAALAARCEGLERENARLVSENIALRAELRAARKPAPRARKSAAGDAPSVA